jgi:hypothetical protein
MSTASKRTSRTLCAVLLAVAVAVAALSTATAASAKRAGDPADAVEAYERDVYVIVGSTLRNPDATTSTDAPLFNVAGVSLDLTWGQWTGASATSSMRANGGHTDADLVLGGLVPNGVYSVFYITIGPDSENPLCLNVERALELTSTDKRQLPDRSSFVAQSDGTAAYSGRVDGNLLDATQVFLEVIYHFDGQTYGSLPNRGEWLTQGQPTCRSSFGEDAMRHLLITQKL